MLLHHVQPTDRLAPAVKTERPLSQTSNQLLHSGAASGHRPQQAPWPAAAAAISQLKGAATALAVPGFWMLELFLSARIFALISLLFVAPTVWDLLRQASVTNSRPGFGLRSPFQRNMKGHVIEASADYAQRMVAHPQRRAKAAIVVVARNGDCNDVLLSMRRMEERFNSKFKYPYVFLNNEPFDADFQTRTTAATQAQTMYGLIPHEHWSYPPWVTQEDAAAAREKMAHDWVLYGARESYHHMCRYFSGFFYRHPLLADFDYYWRMEPDVHYYCDLDYDPFLYMQENGLLYGFVIAAIEGPKTIPSLWDTVQRFRAEHSSLVPQHNLLPWVTADDGSYNLCHFWSNFEIGNLNFFRSPPYSTFFDYLDREGGFFLERWGDAPVHSLGAALFLNASQVHFFQDIGYRHNSMLHCPAVNRNKCACDAQHAVQFRVPAAGRCHHSWQEFTAAPQSAGRALHG